MSQNYASKFWISSTKGEKIKYYGNLSAWLQIPPVGRPGHSQVVLNSVVSNSSKIFNLLVKMVQNCVSKYSTFYPLCIAKLSLTTIAYFTYNRTLETMEDKIIQITRKLGSQWCCCGPVETKEGGFYVSTTDRWSRSHFDSIWAHINANWYDYACSYSQYLLKLPTKTYVVTYFGHQSQFLPVFS